ncbi:hypothetical protein EVAR_818_1 [Eumeta japonica]|uniref:Uncharacterized protein n=1 Tax=Eumeta variegata TaxID=151549 RepID=A0A4C1SD09_EUMVA|nr:hypothetical protein EVAR_818_1 [Eumeta japonica]
MAASHGSLRQTSVTVRGHGQPRPLALLKLKLESIALCPTMKNAVHVLAFRSEFIRCTRKCKANASNKVNRNFVSLNKVCGHIWKNAKKTIYYVLFSLRIGRLHQRRTVEPAAFQLQHENGSLRPVRYLLRSHRIQTYGDGFRCCISSTTALTGPDLPYGFIGFSPGPRGFKEPPAKSSQSQK